MKPLRILAWPIASPNNRYPQALNAELAKHAVVAPFAPDKATLRRAFASRFDILQIHWLEAPFWTRRRTRMIRNTLIALLCILILKLRGTRIVWTAHDPEPHVMAYNDALRRGLIGVAWRLYISIMLRAIDAVILLSVTHAPQLAARHRRLARLPRTVIPHPHYRGVYPDKIDRGAARTSLGLAEDPPVLLFLGNMRPYKNADGLIAAFRKSTAEAVLLLAGAADDAAYADTLRTLAGSDPRIRLQLGFVDDDDLQLYLRAADAIVIPFRHVTNSGSVALALSYDCPVAVPDVPVFREIAAAVGARWINLFGETIDAAAIDRIVAWAREDRCTARPDLDSFAWDRIAGGTINFFTTLIASRSAAATEPDSCPE